MNLKTDLINLARRARGVYRSILEREVFLNRLESHDVKALNKASAKQGGSLSAEVHILLTSTGFRNIGDQAMFEAYCRGVLGPVVAITGPRATYTVPSDLADRVRLCPLPQLVYGSGKRRLSHLQKFAEMISTAKSFTVVGADLMDGGYQHRLSSILWTFADYGAKRNVDTRVLGFSWRAEAPNWLYDRAARAGQNGAKLLVRDPHSFERLKARDTPGIELVSDVVFSDRTMATDRASQILAALKVDQSRKFMLLNTSGLIARKNDLIEDYLQVIKTAGSLGIQVVLAPHVDDLGGGDFGEGRRVIKAARELLGVSVPMVDELLAPAEMRSLASLSQIVVTGRMHLAVLGLSQTVPTIVLATQGKVSGLMESVGLPQNCVEPREGCGSEISTLLSDFASVPAERQAAVARALPLVRERAQLNFTGLR